jgi:hypothetical protein
MLDSVQSAPQPGSFAELWKCAGRGGFALAVSFALHSPLFILDMTGSVPGRLRPLLAVAEILKGPPAAIAGWLFHPNPTIAGLLEFWVCSLGFYALLIWICIEIANRFIERHA